ncbi:Pr6Pr family membrane protein [Leucobacter sp. CSA1]|uniref:Pr6Pr family membrane protein n=1 Tax=Leucobacter chromiisoli TaxID=2796471 RepID=A0A934UV12_9MICO|nr:Pr6Pr family membrane protein [Leucobacter chromiisoli]
MGPARVLLGVVVLGILVHAYLLEAAAGNPSPFDYFGYFTNLTSLLTCGLLITSGALLWIGRTERRDAADRPVPSWLAPARAAAATCMLVVGVVYSVLVPGTGSAPPWVSAALHLVFPLLVLLDWLVPDGSRPPRWRDLWIVLPYPLAWLTVVLIRGVTDGWVPYGFLLPERGIASLVLHIAGLLLALLAAALLVWAGARIPPRTARREA